MHSATWGFFHSKESPNAHDKKDAVSFHSIIPISATLVYPFVIVHPRPTSPEYTPRPIPSPWIVFLSIIFMLVFQMFLEIGRRYRYRLKRYLPSVEISTKAFARLLRLISKRLFVEHRDRDPIEGEFSTKQIVEGANCRREYWRRWRMAKRESKTKVDWLSKLDSNTMNGLLSRRASFSFPFSHQSFSSLFLPRKLSIHGDSSNRPRFDFARVKFFVEASKGGC